ncbi:MAG TPA: hypothetical protein DDW49_04310 [Deltaproteobacteria bacterium]|nr:hypothetical protein [Deltaproteobacteria bacterium]
MAMLGKRNFLLHASKYLKKVEETGEAITITHQNQPRLKIVPFKPKTIKDLRGAITHLRVKGDLNKPILGDFDSWSF